jgi:ABC-type Co2+ transport system permease subunit
VLQVAALVALWIAFARRRRTSQELVEFAAAAVVAFIALGKVLSPQFIIWLIPLVPLVRRWSAVVLFVAVLVLTQAWFPQHYWDYALGFDETVTWIVLARDVALLALLAALVMPPLAARAAVVGRARRRASSSPA